MITELEKWPKIVAIAKSLGAGRWAIYKWGERGGVPAKWQVAIVNASNGKIKLADFSKKAET